MTELSNQIDACKARRQRFADAEIKYANKGRTEADIRQAVVLEKIMHPEMQAPIPQEQFAAASEIAFPRITIDLIQRAVASFYGVSQLDIVSARRTRNIVRPRQVAYYLSKKLTGKSMPEIGRRFGGRDHTTILSGFRSIDGLRSRDPVLETNIRTIAVGLGGELA